MFTPRFRRGVPVSAVRKDQREEARGRVRVIADGMRVSVGAELSVADVQDAACRVVRDRDAAGQDQYASPFVTWSCTPTDSPG